MNTHIKARYTGVPKAGYSGGRFYTIEVTRLRPRLLDRLTMMLGKVFCEVEVRRVVKGKVVPDMNGTVIRYETVKLFKQDWHGVGAKNKRAISSL